MVLIDFDQLCLTQEGDLMRSSFGLQIFGPNLLLPPSVHLEAIIFLLDLHIFVMSSQFFSWINSGANQWQDLLDAEDLSRSYFDVEFPSLSLDPYYVSGICSNVKALRVFWSETEEEVIASLEEELVHFRLCQLK